MTKKEETKTGAPRSAQWFIREIKRRVAQDPTRAIRFDVLLSERAAALDAWDTIAHERPARKQTNNVFTDNRDKRGKVQAIPVKLGGRGWKVWRSEALVTVDRGKIERWAMFPPDYAWPGPVERVLVATVKDTIEKRLDTGKMGREMQSKLQSKYGPDYYVEMPGATALDDPALPPGLYCDVWRGEDWLLVSKAEFYPAEIPAAIHALDEHATDLRHQRDDAAALGAAHVRRENIVASLGSMPEGPTGDAIRALDSDALQVFQLRQGMNANGRRNTWAQVAEQFRSERKPGKRYTRARVQQIHRDTLEAYPALRSYGEALTAKAKQQFEDEDAAADAIDAPGAYGVDGRIRAESGFDLDELSIEREGGTRFRVTRDLRNRGI